MSMCWATTVGHPHAGLVPSTVMVSRLLSYSGALTSRTYLPAVPGTEHTESQGYVFITPVGLVSRKVASFTRLPVAESTTRAVNATGMGHGGIRQPPPQE